MTKTWTLGLAAICALAAACGDDTAGAEKCPVGAVVGATQACTCAAAADAAAPMGTQVCQMDGNLSACDCGGGTGGTSGGVGGTTAGAGGAAGTTVGGSGGTSGTDDDAGMSTAGTSGGKDDGGSPTGPDKPATDGSQLASCDPANASECDGGLTCYSAGTEVGYCTKTCVEDSDCEGIGDATYTCSSAGLGATQSCRISCTGEEDKTCPEHMSCIEVPTGAPGTFRCLYDTKDIGKGTAKRFEECEVDGDCEGDLTCYTADYAGNPGPGASFSGYCTGACEEAADCDDLPKTGSAELGCGSDDVCRLSCEIVLGGGPSSCPTGMTCANIGLTGGGMGRCLYGGTSGGI